MMHPAVWTWEVPLYFWFGGIATGSRLRGRWPPTWRATTPRPRWRGRWRWPAALPCAPLLIMDLGRPLRFLNMLRIFKPRSPMSMGAWCLSAFSSTRGRGGGRRPDRARARGARAGRGHRVLRHLPGLLHRACCWPPPRCRCGRAAELFLPPIFVCTATATGAAATRLALAATGTASATPRARRWARSRPPPMAMELGLSTVNEKPPGPPGRAAGAGPARARSSRWPSGACAPAWRCASRASAGARGRTTLASVLYLLGGLAFRFAWVGAGRTSAGDDEAVAPARAQSSTVRLAGPTRRRTA